VTSIAAPPRRNKVAYGGYIANVLAHCMESHTPAGPHGRQEFAHHRGAGGFVFEIRPGVIVRSANITPDKETGIGSWSGAQIKRAITRGIGKNGRRLIPLMPYSHFSKMSSEDLEDVVADLHTIPAVHNAVKPNPSPEALGMAIPKL
jgi:hypothetical protein